jgi:hypothetical protein
MKNRLITAVAAAAVAVSGMSATPAAAWGEKEQNALALILGLGVAGAILNDMEDGKHRPKPTPARYKVIPSECVYEVKTRKGYRDVVSKSCVAEFGLKRLPAECAFDVRTRNGTRTVFGPRCLQDFGYRIEDARY